MSSEDQLTPKPLPENLSEEELAEQVEKSLHTATPVRSLTELVYWWFREKGIDEGEALGVLLRFFERELTSGERDADYDVVTEVMDCLVGWGGGRLIRRPQST